MTGRVFPTPATEVPGNFIASALWNSQVNALNSFLGTPPVFKGLQTTTQSIPSSNATSMLTMQSANVDTEGGWSSVTNPNRYTVQTAGRYLLIANVCIGAGTSTDTTNRGAVLLLNGTIIRISQTPANTNNIWQAQTSTAVLCAVGDYLQFGAIQQSGGALSTAVANLWNQPSLEIYWQGAN